MPHMPSFDRATVPRCGVARLSWAFYRDGGHEIAISPRASDRN